MLIFQSSGVAKAISLFFLCLGSNHVKVDIQSALKSEILMLR